MKESAAKAIRQRRTRHLSCARSGQKWIGSRGRFRWTHRVAVAASVLKLRTLNGIERPAVACLLPTERNVFVLIDAGANPDSNPENLVQFAIMGSVFSAQVLGYNNPSVALMSISEEDMKGSDVTKEAFKLLKVSGLNFRGNIEGHDLFEKPAEVVVCDGFTGNVVLKTTEAVAHAIFSWLKHELFHESRSQARRKARRGCIQSRFGKKPIMRSTVACRCSAQMACALSLMERVRRWRSKMPSGRNRVH